MPDYLPGQKHEIKIDGRWEPCWISVDSKMKNIRILAEEVYSNTSFPPKIGDKITFDFNEEFKLTFFNRYKIEFYWQYVLFMEKFYRIRDKYERINQLNFVLLGYAVFVSFLFWAFNYIFDNAIIDLINQSTLLQSIIFGFTAVGIFGIFHPVSLREEVSKDDIDKLIKRRIRDSLSKFEKDHDLNDKSPY